MNIHESTERYEAWLRRRIPVVASQLRDKHALMRKDPFRFLRGTFYRWAQLWSEADPALRRAPRVIAVGDLHVDSFGTWRDREGRLAWGVDDFDDAYPLPYTNDLVRLAASLEVAINAGVSGIGLGSGCEAILDGYARTLRDEGNPIVLAEGGDHMDKLGIRELKPAAQFWATLTARPAARDRVPGSATRALRATLPDRRLAYRVVRREAGDGSLGQPRYVALTMWDGGHIAREVKALVPSACVWAAGRPVRGQPYYERALRSAIRSPDPFQCVVGPWIIRRLSPDANPIALADLSAKRDESTLLAAMGTEAANVHLGTHRQRSRILADLRRRSSGWLRDAAKTMAKAIHREWKEYRRD